MPADNVGMIGKESVAIPKILRDAMKKDKGLARAVDNLSSRQLKKLISAVDKNGSVAISNFRQGAQGDLSFTVSGGVGAEVGKTDYYTPEQLGFDKTTSDRFRAAGYEKLPKFMADYTSSKGKDFGGEDIVTLYSRVGGKAPTAEDANKGKKEKALNQLHWGFDSNGNLVYKGYSKGEENIANPMTVKYAGDANREWGPNQQAAYEAAYLSRKTEANTGFMGSETMKALASIGAILAPVGGLYAAGAFAPATAAPAVGGSATTGLELLANNLGTGVLNAPIMGGGYTTGLAAGGAAGGLDLLANNAISGGNLIGTYSAPVMGGGFSASNALTSALSELGLSSSMAPNSATAPGVIAPAGKAGIMGSPIKDAAGNLITTETGGLTGNALLDKTIGLIVSGALPLAGNIFATLAQTDAYKDASKEQRKAAENALNALQNMYQQTRADLQPYNLAGQGEYGLGFLTGGATLNETDPIYMWKQKEAEKAVNAALAARGLYNSRPGINALSEAAMKVSSDEAEKQWNRAFSLAGLGENAAAATGYMGTKISDSEASILKNLGNSNALSALGQGNSLSNLWAGLGTFPINALTAYGYGKQAGLWG